MGLIQDKKDSIKKMSILKSYCKKYMWDLPYSIRIEVSNLIHYLDKEIIDSKEFISSYIRKSKESQLTIYDYIENER